MAEPSPPASPDSPSAASEAPGAKTPAAKTPGAKTPGVKPAGAAAEAKVKPPAPEDKPFSEFVPQLLLPALAKECQAYGGPAPNLVFEEGPMPVVGGNCWMVKGDLPAERRFWLCFATPELGAIKTIALAEGGSRVPSLLESFLIDEKKMTLALIVSRLVQRLNGQKWLGPN